MKSLLKKTALLASIASLVLATQAHALSISLADSRYLGWVDPSTPASAAGEVGSINDLRTVLPAGEPVPDLDDVDGVVNGANIGRTGVSVVGLPAATTVGADSNNSPSGSVDVTGFDYLLAKYGTTAHIWYVGGLIGTQSVPLNEPGGDLGTQGQSHYSLYNPSTTTTVPDGGATVALLGAALTALAFGRRFRR